MQIITSKSNLFKFATLFIQKQKMYNKEGKTFNVYAIFGNSYAIKSSLMILGFKWNFNLYGWTISENKMTDKLKKQLEQIGVNIDKI